MNKKLVEPILLLCCAVTALVVTAVLIRTNGLIYLFGVMEIPVVVLFGWPWYVGRVAGQVAVNWDGVLTCVVCLAVLAGGLHAFCGWLYGQMQTPAEGQVPRAWRKRWTASILGVVVLMFVAGIAAVGVTHQTAWLANSPRPLFETNPFR